MGLLGWSTDQFWRSTPHDFWRGFKGWRRANGRDKPQGNNLSREERTALQEMIEEHKQIDAAMQKKKANKAK